MAGQLSTAKDADLALPKGSLILVTGASGFIGSNVVYEALEAGYKVRGTARSEEKCKRTKETFRNHSNYETAVVADFQHDGTFDEAMKGVHAVIHVASDTTFGSDPNQVIKPTVAGIQSILKSAAKESSVKRFVLTSSSTAVLLPKTNKEFSVSGKDWNQEALDIAWAAPPYNEDRAFPVYAASKTEAEKALWKFMADQKPGFVANAILPNMNIGRVLDAPGATGAAIPKLVKDGRIPAMPPQYFIDVIDDARLHVIAAVLDSSLKDERIFGFAEAFNWTKIIKAIKEVRPDASLPNPPENEGQDLSKIPNEPGAELLRRWYGQKSGWKPLAQSIKENLEGQV